MHPMSVDELKQMAAVIRCDIIEMICMAGAGHPGGSLSATDIVTALYFRMMRIDPTNPRWTDDLRRQDLGIRGRPGDRR